MYKESCMAWKVCEVCLTRGHIWVKYVSLAWPAGGGFYRNSGKVSFKISTKTRRRYTSTLYRNILTKFKFIYEANFDLVTMVSWKSLIINEKACEVCLIKGVFLLSYHSLGWPARGGFYRIFYYFFLKISIKTRWRYMSSLCSNIWMKFKFIYNI